MLEQHSRLRDPLVASTIFAPTPWNHMLSSITAGEGVAEAIAVDWVMEQDSQTINHMLTNQRRDIGEVKRFVAAFCEQLEQVAVGVYGLQSASITAAIPLAAPRIYPFAGHLNLLGLPIIDGVNFDADDFVEH